MSKSGPVPTSVETRFWKYVSPEPNSGCWLWTGAVQSHGYGHIHSAPDRKWVRAHRLSYEMHKGPIPEGLDLDHKCRVRSCVNPDHLEPVTRIVNLFRSPIFIGNKTHCKHGHLFDEKNTRRRTDRPGRICRRCHVLGINKMRAKKRETTNGD